MPLPPFPVAVLDACAGERRRSAIPIATRYAPRALLPLAGVRIRRRMRGVVSGTSVCDRDGAGGAVRFAPFVRSTRQKGGIRRERPYK
jgi:hypothetical protein